MIRRYFAVFMLSFSALAGLVVMSPQTAQAACATRFLTFPTWYNNVIDTGSCEVQSPEKVGGLQKFILIIAMNFIEILLQIVAYLAVGYIMWGGFKYITAYGEPGEIVVARQRILNAVIGLVIAMMSVAIVSFIGSNLK
jgi:hypothetical protein